MECLRFTGFMVKAFVTQVKMSEKVASPNPSEGGETGHHSAKDGPTEMIPV